MPQDILIVDDEKDICEMVSDVLVDAGYTTRFTGDSEKALEEIKRKAPYALVVDICMEKSKIDGLALLEIVKKHYPSIPVIIISGHGTISTAVQALKIGAADYIEKPFTHEKIRSVVSAVLQRSPAVQEELVELTGSSGVMKKLRSEIGKLSKQDSRILIEGPPAVGKEKVARWIHQNSKRRAGAFIVVNPHIFMDLKEGEKKLFGSIRKNIGISLNEECLLEKAHKGTIFLKEISAFPIEIQQRLLQLVQDKICILNGNSLDIRIISSTSQSLDYRVKIGKLKPDLLYRLNVATLKIPALREHREDIAALSELFIRKISEERLIPVKPLQYEAMAIIQGYFWPGNIKELYEVLERAALLAEARISQYLSESKNIKSKNDLNSCITIQDLPVEIFNNMATFGSIPNQIAEMPLKEAREEFEKIYLKSQLMRFSNNISKTAEFVKMERSALYRKLKILRL